MSDCQFVKLTVAVLARRDLTPAGKLVYAVIVDAMRGKVKSWPSVRAIAHQAGLSRNTVTRAVTHLEQMDLIEVRRGNRGQANSYSLPTTIMGTSEQQSQDKEASDDRSHESPQPGNSGDSESGKGEESGAFLGPGVAKMTPQVSPKCGRKQTRRKKQARRRRVNEPSAVVQTSKRSNHRQLCDHFTQKWSESVGGRAKYPFSGARDGVALKRILEVVGDDLQWAVRIVDAYFQDDDPWLRDKGAGLGLLASGPRLQKYTTMTADNAVNEGTSDGGQPEHPLVSDARARWPDDVAAFIDEWQSLAAAAECGQLPLNAVKNSPSKGGAAFRAEHSKEVEHVAP
ncbi:MAG: helix-turn-helix domain-containing protein [Planctomycetes bacterium]|nr:helix-turn-helix domain-containing protein [Planctomycetota bacterium]